MRLALLILRAQRMLDVVSGRIVSPATIVIADSYISAVNPTTLPADAPIVDLGNAALLPGFIDMRVHLLLKSATRFCLDVIAETPAEAVPRSTVIARKTLLAGFTTVRELGLLYPTKDRLEVSMVRAIDAGWIDSPRHQHHRRPYRSRDVLARLGGPLPTRPRARHCQRLR